MINLLIDRLTASPLVGVDVGSAACKVVEVSRSGSKVTLRHVGVRLVVGQPAAVLKRALAEAGVTAGQAAVGLASPEVVVKPFEMPPMPRKELSAAVLLEAESASLNGHTKHEVAMDWQTLASNPRESIRGLLAVVPRSIVASRVATVREAALEPVVVDVEGLALWNAYWVLRGSHEPEPQTVFLVNIGARTTNLVIGHGPDALMLLRDIQLGAPISNDALAQDWLAEIRDSLGYARSKGGLRALDAVHITGGGASPRVMPLLQSVVSAPVTIWNPFNTLLRDGRGPWVDESAGPLFAIAIGLALRKPS